MVRPIKISVVADADRARKELSSFGNTLKSTLIAGAGVVGAVGIVEGLKDVVSSASEAQQSLGATESIFGRYADTVTKKSKEAADSVGLSANAYRESSNLLGALFKNQGVELAKLSTKTEDHLKLAADLSAMYGGDVPLAVEALTAAYKGEFNQLEKYGISLKQDTINSEAAAIAKRKYGKELKALSPRQQSLAKQLATQQLLFRQSSDAAGTFAKESNTLAGQQQRLNAELDNAKAQIGTALLPLLTDLAEWTRDEIVPGLEDFAEWLGRNQDEITGTAREIGGHLLPVLQGAGDVLGFVVELVKDMPEPLRGIAVQAALAAVALPRLTSAATLTGTGLSNLTTTIKDAEKRSAALGTALRNVAGLAGMVALAQGAQESDRAVGTLLTTLGGAATGFAIGGPIGGLVGGLGGLTLATFRSEEAARTSMTTWQTYASTLDQVTGATTNATKSMVIQELQQSKLFDIAGKLGISRSTLVDGIVGEGKARGQLADAMDREKAAIKKLEETDWDSLSDEQNSALTAELLQRRKNLKALQDEVGEVRNASDAKREEIALLKGIPESVVTRIQTPGAVDSVREIANLAAQFKLTPKQIQTVIQMSGVKTSKDDVVALQKQLERTGKVKVDDAWAKAFGEDLRKTQDRARSGLGLLDGTLSKVGNNAKPNIARGPFGRGVSGDLSALIAITNQKANGVGNNLGRGMYSGMGGWIQPIASRAREMVLGAIAAANGAAQINSPSRKTRETGEQLGAGLVVGMRRSEPSARRGGASLIAAVRAGVDDGAAGVSKALDKITAQIEKSVTGKKQTQIERALLKRYAAQYAALRKNGAAQDALNVKLEKARDRLKDLTDQYDSYRKAIADSVKATGDVTQLGKQEDGTVSLTTLLNDLRNRVADAKRFAVLTQELAKKGLSRTAIQQMLDAGPEAALATAEAIASGGSAAITEINTLQAQLAATGNQLGDAMAKRYYGAGVAAAKGLVKGLEAEAKNLDRSAVRLANALVAAVKKALKIKSPSRVFMGIGDNVVKGLDIGLDDTYAKRSGATLAASLQKGFGTPALDAMASFAGTGPSAQPIVIRLTPDDIDRLSRGKALQADLDYARSNGVRGETF